MNAVAVEDISASAKTLTAVPMPSPETTDLGFHKKPRGTAAREGGDLPPIAIALPRSACRDHAMLAQWSRPIILSKIDDRNERMTMRRRMMREIADLAYQLEADRLKAKRWLAGRQLPDFGHRTIVEVVCEGDGEQVLRQLEKHQRLI
ncbi:hypothetical protein [Piscinibacter gummiphilus]|nr:hypothetical protein [Piscinibacter gummiphilus]